MELRAQDDPATALASLRASGVAGEDAFAIGATLTIPLNDRSPRDAIAAIGAAGVAATSITTRSPTLDDVYLQLTGESLAA